MVAYVSQLLLAITATARELMSVMLSSVKSSFKKAILHEVALGMEAYTANIRANTIRCMLTFIRIINITSESLKARTVFVLKHFVLMSS